MYHIKGVSPEPFFIPKDDLLSHWVMIFEMVAETEQKNRPDKFSVGGRKGV